ncbi:PaaI family thioesterase [Alicyclobacillus sp. ALC3]|uniref:PaaI family thioesterase n=1 Tax=Alicyclobacillus sp. ALC3 TaxID=2796143 RepID=UPI0023787B3B|nr:PaaI family thioesterase [Alicyclobacillus sp. ALC3]WDL97918.1 hypothetical protein JC200_04160 [Alicyclobacillus sp. ALC3]
MAKRQPLRLYPPNVPPLYPGGTSPLPSTVMSDHMNASLMTLGRSPYFWERIFGRGITHGGVASSILDEATAYVTSFMGTVALTAQLQVDFRDPIRIREHVEVAAHATKVTRRVVEVEAFVYAVDGELKACSQARMLILSEQQRQEMGLANLP